MKWGVRRYRKLDGSYTKKGIEVFDKKLKEYESADRKVKSLKGSNNKDKYYSAIRERKIAKNKLDKSYKQVKADVRADKGKKLYGSGKTITGNMSVHTLSQAGIIVGSGIVGRMVYSKTGNMRAAQISTASTAIGGTIVNGILAAKRYTENKNLRAYYGHTRTIRG